MVKKVNSAKVFEDEVDVYGDVLSVKWMCERFKLARKVSGMSQTEAAKKMGVEQGTISNIETFKCKAPEYKTIKAVMKFIADHPVEGYSDIPRQIAVRPSDTPPSGGVQIGDAVCGKCKNVAPGPKSGASRCWHCGSKISIECRSCKRLNSIDNAYCAHCGHSLSVGSASSDVRGIQSYPIT